MSYFSGMIPIPYAPAVPRFHFLLCLHSVCGVAFAALSACAASTGTLTRYSADDRFATPSTGVQSYNGPALADAEARLAGGDVLGAAGRYQQAAIGATPSLAAEYRLRAAELANVGSDPARADLILDQIPAAPLDAAQQTRYRLLRAQTALARNDPARALRLLPLGDPGGEPVLAERLLLTRARAQGRIGDVVGATQTLVLRERYLTAASALADNRDTIWSELIRATLDAGTLGRAATIDSIARGWVELAALARRNASLQDYDSWRKRYPDHPGELRLANLYLPNDGQQTALPNLPALKFSNRLPGAAAAGFNTVPARGILAALLLPQSGALTGIGEAVRAGYASAAAKAGGGEPRVYDPAAGVAAVYKQAVADGAGYAVGPLQKDYVAALAQNGSQSGGLPTPVLALNYLDGGATLPAGFYQFGLAPEDEARAAAADALARGLRRALAMVPNTDWGNRVLLAFEQRMRELGGQVVEAGRYSGGPQDWSDPVRRLLRYVAIDDKKKAAAARAGVAPGVDPQRRNDFDFVFIAGRAAQARVLRPLFRYYHADRLPMYATSAVFEGSGDSDISGIRFCDSPWVLDLGGPWAQLHDEALTGRSFDSARLYVFGSDAFMLAARIAHDQLRPDDTLAGATGILHVDGSGAIRRELVCAQMTSGAPFVLGAPGGTP